MSSEGMDGVCWVCVRGLAGGRGVKTSSHLRHSARSISQAIQDLTQQEADNSARLCFRCYRLVLGIDHHKHQLERQQKSFLDIYHSAHVSRRFTEIDDRDVNNDGISCEVMEDSTASIDSNSDIRANTDETLEQIDAASVTDIPFGSLEPRKKRAKKWGDYHYYDEEGKTGDTDNVEYKDNTVAMEQYVNINLANRKTRITCNACNEDFSTHRHFGRHDCQQSKWKGRRGKVTYTCKGCQATFTMRRDYIRHIESCYKNVPVTCDLCMVRLPSAAYLPRHLSSFHKGSSAIKKGSLCEQCGRGFSRKESLERHQATVHGVAHGSHQCPQCGKTFPHTAILAEHLRAHRGYPCVDCGNKRTFSCVSNLLLHRRTHHSSVHHSSGHSSTTHPFHCLPCNKRWKFHASYTYHMRKYHSGEDDGDKSEDLHRCRGCNLPLTSHKALFRHAQSCPANTSMDLTTGIHPSLTQPPRIQTSVSPLYHPSEGSKMGYRGLKSKQNASGRSGEKPKIVKTTGTRPAKTVLAGNKCSGKQTENSAGDGEKVTSVCVPGEAIIVERGRMQETTQFPVVSESLPSPCSTTFTPTPLAPASEIVLEALEDLSGDCQFVILVEDCLSEAGGETA